MSVGAKILMIAISFSLPIAVLAYLMVVSINANLAFATAEIAGNEYLRPLQRTLQRVQDHQWIAATCTGPEDGCDQKLATIREQVQDALGQLAMINIRHGTGLKFTADELAKRGRQHQTALTVSEEWKEAAASGARIPPEKYQHLIADLRTMITHAGDTSNLILDPDLDSYYLMDVTLLALPQTEDRMGAVAIETMRALRGKPTDAERVSVAVAAALLREDRTRVVASTETALNEDANFYGSSPTLRAGLETPLKKYRDAAIRLEELTQQASAPNSKVAPEDYAQAGVAARQAAFEYWDAGVAELDVLLEARLDHYRGSRTQSLLWSGLALLLSCGQSFYFMRSITTPLSKLIQSLGPGATLLSECVGRISEVSQGQTVDPMEAKIICGELDAHADSMRKAVLELAKHVSGGGDMEPAELASSKRS